MIGGFLFEPRARTAPGITLICIRQRCVIGTHFRKTPIKNDRLNALFYNVQKPTLSLF